MDTQCNGTDVQHGQRSQEWDLPQNKYFWLVKNTDPAALIKERTISSML